MEVTLHLILIKQIIFILNTILVYSTGDARSILDHLLSGPGKHQAYNRLADLTDTYGNRLSGSKALEDAIGEYSAKLIFVFRLLKSLLFSLTSSPMAHLAHNCYQLS